MLTPAARFSATRKKARVRQIVAEAFRGSDGVLDPDGLVYPDARDKGNARKNKDYFLKVGYILDQKARN